MSHEKPREITVRVLNQRGKKQGFTENLLEQALAQASLSPANKALVQELTYGIVRSQAALDWLISRKTRQAPQRPLVQILLRLGLYQMFWLERIPPHAAVHETVQLAKQFKLPQQAGFINAILRAYSREQTETRALLQELKLRQPALGYSHPEWLCMRWQERWGKERLKNLLEWNNTPPKTFARINTLKTNPAQLTAAWSEEEVRFTPFQAEWIRPNLVFQLESNRTFPSLPSFQQGLFYIQDPSTLLAAQELDPQPDETILDMCAAPGGKTTFIAQRMQNRGLISAQDIYPQRLLLVAENCARLGVSCVETSRPSKILFPELTHQFHRVLVDAPCSNTGVLRRRVDLRWRIREGELARLAQMQSELLHEATLQLRLGGILIYSTCSIEPEENQQVVQAFLEEHRDFQLEKERELLPFHDSVDGAYVARMRKAG